MADWLFHFEFREAQFPQELHHEFVEMGRYLDLL